MFIYFERERARESREGAEREGDTESETGSRLRAVRTESDVGHELTNREIMTWAQVGRLTDSATQAPPSDIFNPHLQGFLDDQRTGNSLRDRKRITNDLKKLG